jgi:hypothetical protein
MGALGGSGNEASTARDLFIHVSRMEEYKEAIRRTTTVRFLTDVSGKMQNCYVCYAVRCQYE